MDPETLTGLLNTANGATIGVFLFIYFKVWLPQIKEQRERDERQDKENQGLRHEIELLKKDVENLKN